MKQLLIKLEYTGNLSDKKLSIRGVERIVEDILCKGIKVNKYKLLITKFELLRPSGIFGIYEFNILLRFDSLSDSPLNYNFKSQIDRVFKNLGPKYAWSSKGVINYNYQFKSLLSLLSNRELKALYSLAIKREYDNLSYKTDYIVINEKGFDSNLIIKNIKL